MSLKSRLARLEQHAPLGGEHAFVRVIEAHIDALVYVSRCACGDPWSRQHPELRIVLHGRGTHEP
jgi:hypothetical protein